MVWNNFNFIRVLQKADTLMWLEGKKINKAKQLWRVEKREIVGRESFQPTLQGW